MYLNHELKRLFKVFIHGACRVARLFRKADSIKICSEIELRTLFSSSNVCVYNPRIALAPFEDTASGTFADGALNLRVRSNHLGGYEAQRIVR
jgi:hypothetical protein